MIGTQEPFGGEKVCAMCLQVGSRHDDLMMHGYVDLIVEKGVIEWEIVRLPISSLCGD